MTGKMEKAEKTEKMIVKNNALINASYNLDLVEQRLILLAILEARGSGKGINANDPLTVHAESYINQFRVHRTTAYQALKDACEDLFARQFSYKEINLKGNIESVKSRWVSEIRYIDTEASVKLIFAPAIVPLITRLEEQFTKYEIEQISNLNSAYAVRLYEILICWRTSGKTPIIDINEFRDRMGVLSDEYKRIAHLKERIIEQAIKQVNKHTDIDVTYDQHKNGRSIIGFSFSFNSKNKPVDKQIGSSNKKPTKITTMSDAQRHLFAKKMSEMPEMSKYSQGAESYAQFAKRISDMLLDPKYLKEFSPILKSLGFK